MISLRFDLASPNLRKKVLFLTYNNLVNWQGNFIALGLFTDTDVLSDIVIFYLSNSEVETPPSKKTALYTVLDHHI